LLSESFPQAAARHLHDAKILLNKKRWDNAVYLAGYVVECGFKVLVEVYIPEGKTAVKKYGHDLAEIQGKAMDRLRLIYPVLMQLPASRTMETVLDQYHPERRYYKSGMWNKTEAKNAVKRAEQIYQEIIPKLVLDGRLSSKEL
jgi:HEPN domain-containing protein